MKIISDWSVLEGVNDLERSWRSATIMSRRTMNEMSAYRRCNEQHGCGKKKEFVKEKETKKKN